MIIISSDTKYYLGRSGKGLITSLGLETNESSNKNKKERHAITKVSMTDFSKIIKDFEKLPYKGMYGRGPRMNPLTVTFTYQDSFIFNDDK